MVSGARSLEAIARSGRDRGGRLAGALGFTRQRTPCPATVHHVVKRLDAGLFESALQRWLRSRQDAGWRAVSTDGKRRRGTQGHQLPGVHLLAAYEHASKAVIGQPSVESSTNAHQAALALLGLIDVEGATVTGDAMFRQRDLSQEVLEKKGIISGRSRTTRTSSKRRSSTRSRVMTTPPLHRVNAG